MAMEYWEDKNHGDIWAKNWIYGIYGIYGIYIIIYICIYIHRICGLEKCKDIYEGGEGNEICVII